MARKKAAIANAGTLSETNLNIRLPVALLDLIDEAVEKERVKTGYPVSKSAWIRRTLENAARNA